MPSIYQLDTTGVLASNRIIGEQHVITAANGQDHHLVVPVFGPFYETGFVAIYRDAGGTNHTLVKGVDYHFAHQFIGASRATVKPIYGSIALMDLQLAGVVTVGYQTLGGNWVLDHTTVLGALSDSLRNPRVATWEQVVDVPEVFPPVDHEYNLTDLVGMSDVADELDAIGLAIANKPVNNIYIDQDIFANKQRIGLGNVDNFRTASDSEARQTESATRFVTPRGVGLAVNYLLQSFKVTYVDPFTQAVIRTTDLNVSLGEGYLQISNTNGSGVTLPSVSPSYAGLMTPALLSKLTNIQANATNVSVANDLSTDVANVALSAAQGILLKGYINNLLASMDLRMTQDQGDARYIRNINGITPDASGSLTLQSNIPTPIRVLASSVMLASHNNGRLYCSGNPTLTINLGLGATFSCEIYSAFNYEGSATVVDKRGITTGEPYCKLEPTPTENTYWLIGFKN